MKGSLELKNSDPLTIAKDSKNTSTSSLEQPQKKKPKHTESRPPPRKFLTFPCIQIKPMSFAYPFDILDPSSDNQLTITDMFAGSKSPSPAIIDLSVRIL